MKSDLGPRLRLMMAQRKSEREIHKYTMYFVTKLSPFPSSRLRITENYNINLRLAWSSSQFQGWFIVILVKIRFLFLFTISSKMYKGYDALGKLKFLPQLMKIYFVRNNLQWWKMVLCSFHERPFKSWPSSENSIIRRGLGSRRRRPGSLRSPD